MELQNILKTKISIGLLGVGAIGTVIAYQLQKNTSNKMCYFSRTKKRSLKLISEENTIEIPIAIQTSISKPIELDWLIICLKEHQFKAARSWFSKLIHSKTKIAVIRNGLNLKEPLLEFSKSEHILECMIDCPTEQDENGVYRTISHPRLTVPKSKLADEFKPLFKDSNIEIHQVNDFKTENWKKLIESASLGAILCIYDSTCEVFEHGINKRLYRRLMEESIQVAKADGALIEDDFIDQMLEKLMHYPKTKGSSMLTDLRHRKPLELGAKNGIISQLGKQYHIETNFNDWIIRILSKTQIKQ